MQAEKIKFLLDLFFPIECMGCQTQGYFVCETCANSCMDAAELSCPSCKLKSPVGSTHPGCQTPHLLDGIFAPLSYKNPLTKSAVKNLKYKNVRKLSVALANILGQKIMENFADYVKNNRFAILPVPLHEKRQKYRGYNQSELIAQELAKILHLECRNLLVRSRETKDQTKLARHERFENVTGAFALKGGEGVRGKNFILVDDVSTTGATLIEAGKALKRKGAGIVWGMAVAKD